MPNSKPWILSYSSPRADSINTGVALYFRISRTAEKPSSSGIITSIIIISKSSGCSRQMWTASIPSAASRTVWPSNSAYLRISARIFSSSSTTKIRYMNTPPCNICIFAQICDGSVMLFGFSSSSWYYNPRERARIGFTILPDVLCCKKIC